MNVALLSSVVVSRGTPMGGNDVIVARRPLNHCRGTARVTHFNQTQKTKPMRVDTKAEMVSVACPPT
jgi:hypothetical protein